MPEADMAIVGAGAAGLSLGHRLAGDVSGLRTPSVVLVAAALARGGHHRGPGATGRRDPDGSKRRYGQHPLRADSRPLAASGQGRRCGRSRTEDGARS
ncbi:hypothetical protein ACGFZB_26520 [Streptomyces cinerochromogenes]|uniref:Uncharacterized protein n=1 Tax=Streptomyces cinerochromogenes TaxID=66422 RepID=A0ABW7B9Q3_9ACTN